MSGALKWNVIPQHVPSKRWAVFRFPHTEGAPVYLSPEATWSLLEVFSSQDVEPPRGLAFGLGSLHRCSRLLLKIEEVCGHTEKSLLTVPHHICGVWWENILLRCHIRVTWCTSAFCGGIKDSRVILVHLCVTLQGQQVRYMSEM